MPIRSNDRDRRVLEEGQLFCDTKTNWPKPCNAHQPSLEELKSMSFSNYVRFVVLKQAEKNGGNIVEDESTSESDEGNSTPASGQPVPAGEAGDEAGNENRTEESRGNGDSNSDLICTFITSTAPEAPTAEVEATPSVVASAPTVTPLRDDINTRFRHKRAPPVAKAPPKPKRTPTKITTPTEYSQGMSKVTLPPGFWDESGICQDKTGRGPDWQPGTRLGDMPIPSPMKQCIRGIGGIYEYTFLDQKSTTAAEYRKVADEYFAQQVGSGDHSVEELMRKFWRRLGPTMPSPMYGADMEGTMFGEDECCGWNLSKLQSCLQLLMSDMPNNQSDGIPGVTTPYLYFGMWASVFCAHAEDMNLLSINYLHAGAPKIWYAVAPGEDARRLEQLCECHYHVARAECGEYLRHKRSLISPQILKKAGIPFTSTVQYPGDAVITFPSGYHFGFNAGFNLAEATNFAVPEWIPFGKQAKICLCRPDSVRIDIPKFERLLDRYERDQSRRPERITWKEWALLQLKKQRTIENRRKKEITREAMTVVPTKRSKQEVKKEIWVEVVQPYSAAMKCKPSKSKKRTPDVVTKEVWHLAKPVVRKAIRPSVRVLCIIPAMVVTNAPKSRSKKGKNVDEDEEQCFAGTIVEHVDDHVRVHLDGLTKKDDVWMPMQSPKLFLDGGRWDDNDEESGLPALHYWREEDSKRRCI